MTMSTSPQAAVEQAFRALDARDWTALFAVLDPDAVANFKARQRHHLEFVEAVREEAAERSRAGAEDAEAFTPPGGLLEHVFAVRDLAAFDALPASLVLRRWLMVSRPRKAEGSPPRREILGEVVEHQDLAHVVFRERAVEDAEVPEAFRSPPAVRVISVRYTDAGWRVGLAGGLVFDEAGMFGIGYNPGEVDPTEGEADFLARTRR